MTATTVLASLKAIVTRNQRSFIELLNTLNGHQPMGRLQIVYSTTLPRHAARRFTPLWPDKAFELLTANDKLAASTLEEALGHRRRNPQGTSDPMMDAALAYVEVRQCLEWLEKFESTLRSKPSTLTIYTHLVQMGVDTDKNCLCFDFGPADLATEWLHEHHGDYNKLVHSLIMHYRKMGALQKAWSHQNDLPEESREAISPYHSQLYGFLQDKPSREWFTNVG